MSVTAVDGAGLVDAVRGLEGVIRDHADEAEARRRPVPAVLDALREAGLFRLFLPRSLGGLEVDPVTCARVIEEVALIDASTGWILQVANSADWWLARLPDQGAEEMYADGPDVLIAAAFNPPIQARVVDGGYRITGRGPLASNAHDAGWFMFTALVHDRDEPRTTDGVPDVVAVFCRSDEATVIDTWHTLGMRATDSNDVEVADVFVPIRRSFPLAPDFEPGGHYRGPVYRFPGIGEAAVVVCPTSLAIARNAVAGFRELAGAKTPFGSATLLAQRRLAQFRLARAEAVLRSARLLFYDTLEAAWRRTLAGGEHALEHKADLLLAGAHATVSAVECVDLVYGLSGTSAIYTRHPLERHFRDVQTLRHHGFASEGRYEACGQVYLGVEPEFGMVAF